VHEIPCKALEIVPGVAAVASIAQRVPSQTSAKGPLLAELLTYSPTAVQSAGETHDTHDNPSRSLPGEPAGDARMPRPEPGHSRY